MRDHLQKKISQMSNKSWSCLLDGWKQRTIVPQMSNVQNPNNISLNPGWSIGILVMTYHNPYITGQDVIPYTANNKGLSHSSNHDLHRVE